MSLFGFDVPDMSFNSALNQLPGNFQRGIEDNLEKRMKARKLALERGQMQNALLEKQVRELTLTNPNQTGGNLLTQMNRVGIQPIITKPAVDIHRSTKVGAGSSGRSGGGGVTPNKFTQWTAPGRQLDDFLGNDNAGGGGGGGGSTSSSSDGGSNMRGPEKLQSNSDAEQSLHFGRDRIDLGHKQTRTSRYSGLGGDPGFTNRTNRGGSRFSDNPQAFDNGKRAKKGKGRRSSMSGKGSGGSSGGGGK